MEKKIGQLIKERMKAQKLTVIEFSELIGTERSNVYNIFERDSIDTNLLKKIGHILEYDFFEHFLEEKTIQKIKLSDNLKKSKVFIQLDVSEDEIVKIGFEEKVLKILNIK